jgi:tripartite-type tricarboxylate transporter receptor subunit TctC
MPRPWIAAVGFAALAYLPSAHAQTPADFYKGRQVSIYVGFSAGVTYDLYARMLARHIGSIFPAIRR